MTYQLGSMTELLDSIEGGRMPYPYVSTAKSTYGWLGQRVSNLKDAVDLARNGWAEGEKTMERFSNRIVDRVKASLPHQSVVWDKTGVGFDMGEVLTGNPDCWYDYAPKEEMKFVRIMVECYSSCGVPSNVIEMRGGAICAVVDALESLNYRVELFLGKSLRDFGGYKVEVKIKGFDEHLDIDKVSFCVAHPSMDRAILSAHAATVTGRLQDTGKYGTNTWAEEYDMFFEGLVGVPDDFSSFDAVEQKVLEMLKVQGVEVTSKVMGD